MGKDEGSAPQQDSWPIKVILGVDGYSDFDALHSGKHNEEVQLCAFEVLAMDGANLRSLPLSMRKANLAPASSRATSSRARSGLICLLPPVGWDWRV
jgi:hypothetical protein